MPRAGKVDRNKLENAQTGHPYDAMSNGSQNIKRKGVGESQQARTVRQTAPVHRALNNLPAAGRGNVQEKNHWRRTPGYQQLSSHLNGAAQFLARKKLVRAPSEGKGNHQASKGNCSTWPCTSCPK
jgi:hypothetical protein